MVGTASADDAVAGGVVQHGERKVDILHLTKMAVPAMPFFCILINQQSKIEDNTIFRPLMIGNLYAYMHSLAILSKPGLGSSTHSSLAAY